MLGRKCGSRTRPVAMEKTSVQRPGEGPWVLPSRSRVTCGGSHRFSESRVLPLSRLLSPTPPESLTIWPPPSLLPRPQPQLHAQPTPAGRLGRPRPGGLLRAPGLTDTAAQAPCVGGRHWCCDCDVQKELILQTGPSHGKNDKRESSVTALSSCPVREQRVLRPRRWARPTQAGTAPPSRPGRGGSNCLRVKWIFRARRELEL